MSTLFISDLHLQDSQPEALGWLQQFLQGPARDCEALYILGDLFEYWIGDDAVSPAARQVATQLAQLGTEGVDCYFQHGNRDFLLGQEYATACGMTLLPESQVVDLYGRPALLLHGDTLCTDDVEYQAFRQQVRNPQWQAGVLALSIEERLQMAQSARDASQQHTGSTDMAIMDVNDGAVRDVFAEHGVDLLIHGHTHRPNHHVLELDNGTVADRYVLSDWYQAGSYLEVSPAGIRSVDL